MMKVFILLCLLCAIHEKSCWSDVKSHGAGQHDPLMRMLNFLYTNGKNRSQFNIESLRKIFVKFEDTLVKHMEKRKKKHGEHVVTDMLNFIVKDNKTLGKDLKEIMKNIPEMHHAKFMRKLKKFLGMISNRKVENMARYKLHHSRVIPTKDIEAKKIKHKMRWAELLKNRGGVLSKEEANVLNNLKEVAPQAVNASESKQVIENWIGKHFRKPHHLSKDEEISPRDLEVLQSINLAMEQSTKDREIQQDLDQSEIGKALLKGLLEERSVLPWANNASLSQMTADQKKAYLEAERKWENRLTQETQRLLEKLHPADAYIIPDLPEYNDRAKLRRAKKLKRMETGRKMRKILGKANRKGMITGNENWNALEKQRRRRNKFKKVLADKSFVDQLSNEEQEWIGIEKNAWKKIRSMEKFVRKFKH